MAKIFLWGLWGFWVLALPVSLAAAAEAPDTGPQAHVQGQGSVWAKPDLAVLLFTIETEAPQAPEATTANARQAQTFLGAVKKLVPSAEAIHSLSFRVEPMYTYPDKGKKPKIAGYRVRHTYRIRLTEVAQVAAVLDAGLAHGATQVQGPRWEHSRQDELNRQAAVLALAQARHLAEALAQSEKLQIKRLRRVTTAAIGSPQPRFMAASKGLEEAPATPIEIGEEEIHARVEAVFDLH